MSTTGIVGRIPSMSSALGANPQRGEPVRTLRSSEQKRVLSRGVVVVRGQELLKEWRCYAYEWTLIPGRVLANKCSIRRVNSLLLDGEIRA
jgi:hypothetical protein